MARQGWTKKHTIMSVIGVVAVVLILLSVLLIAARRSSSATTQGNGTDKPMPVEAIAVETSVLAEQVRIPVTLNPVKESLLAFKFGGRIKQVHVELGTLVKAGTILATLDGTDQENQIKQAKAALAVAEANYANLKAGSRPENVSINRAQLQQTEANLEVQKSNFERIKALYAEGLVAQQQYEAANAAYQAAQAQVKVAREGLALTEAGPSHETLLIAEAQVQQARVAKEIAESQRVNLYITAPFGGYITMIKINVGEMVSPGVPLIGLADLSQFHASGFVGQDLSFSLHDGQEVEIHVQVGAETVTLPGRIIAIGQAVDQTFRTYQVKILCGRGREELKGGMMGEALVKTRVSQAGHPVIPRDALLEENGRSFVYVVDGGRVARREVKTGVDNGDQVEIVSGLQPGERIVVAGQHLLTDGALVEVK